MKWQTSRLQEGVSNVTRVPYKVKYKGLADVLRSAPQEDEAEVFTEMVQRAGEYEREAFERVDMA